MPERLVEPFIEHQGERRLFWLRTPRPVGRTLLLARAGNLAPDALAQGRAAILLGAGSAFGTGGHGTTEGCLLALEELIRGGESVLDAGTGTGILAIAAAKLGAGRVTAVDISPAACREARRNAELNSVAGGVEIVEGGVDAVSGPYDVAVANLRTPILVSILPDLLSRAKPGAALVFSGILERERLPFLELLARSGAAAAGERTVRGWVTLSARRAIRSNGW